jgi:hypothetical protein
VDNVLKWVRIILSQALKNAIVKQLLFLLILISTPFISFAQKSNAVVLKATDPILGTWELDTTAGNFGAPSILYDGDATDVLFFSAGQTTSIAAFDSGGEIACPTSFIAKSDGKKIYGKISDSCAIDEVGHFFEFAYRYDKEKDHLFITVEGQEYRFKRSTK